MVVSGKEVKNEVVAKLPSHEATSLRGWNHAYSVARFVCC